MATPPAFDNTILRQALLRQTLLDILDASLDDRDASLSRNLPPNFSSRNIGRDSLFLSSPQPSLFQLDFSHPSSSLHTHRSDLTASYKISESSFLAATEQAEYRRGLDEARVALVEKRQMMLISEAQERNAFFKQQKQQASYSPFLCEGSQSMQRMAPLTQLPSHGMLHLMPRPTPPFSTVPIGAEIVRAQAPVNATKILKVLGNSLRGKKDPYIDVSGLMITTEQEQPCTVRGGVAEPFPTKLYRMLQDVEEEGKSHIASFYHHGRAFGIHDIDAFTEEILPKYFSKQSKLVSFVRQLNLYGFVRIHSGQNMGGYYHELFLKGRPKLVPFMRRTGASSKGKEDRRKCKDRNVPAIQPDFSAMQPILSSQER
jgi:hypothetical protein